MNTLIQDLRYALRQLRKSPGFTATAIIVLALGIGANTAMFSMVYGVMLRSLPFNEPGQLFTLWERNLKMGYEQNPPAAGNFRDWRDRNRVFEQVAAFDASRTFNLAGSNNPQRVDGAAVSPSLFELLDGRFHLHDIRMVVGIPGLKLGETILFGSETLPDHRT